MLAAERRDAILRALQSGGAVRVADLADELAVSEMTVRRDLDTLDAQDLLRKVHGGAVPRHNRGEEPRSAEKAGQQRAEKAAIAAIAAATVEDGMTIAIGAGTTTTELARHLRAPALDHRRHQLASTSFSELTDPDRGRRRPTPLVYLSGGVRTPSDALVGPVADAAIASFRVDATYLGVHGFDPRRRPDLTEHRRGPDQSDADRDRRPTRGARRPHEVPRGRRHASSPGSNQVHTLISDDGLTADRPRAPRRTGRRTG